MSKFRTFLEATWEELEADYIKNTEPVLLQDRLVQQELTQTGQISHRAAQQALNLPKADDAAFAVRMFNKRNQNQSQVGIYRKKQQDEHKASLRDKFYYHVYPANRQSEIQSQGLQPGQNPVFSNYKKHSEGRIFFCEKQGVSFWEHWVEQHLLHNGSPEQVKTLRMLKEHVKNAEIDSVGTKDSKSPSYFTTESIPPEHLQFVT